jgi:CBS domain-containing protein
VHVETILHRKGHEVAMIHPHTTVTNALHALADHRVGALVVSEDGETISGILSERDIVRGMARAGADLLPQPVQAIMTTDVKTCTTDDTVEHLMAIMTGGRFRHMPVIDEDRKVIGIVSIGDIVKERLGELEDETQTLKDYVRQGW